MRNVNTLYFSYLRLCFYKDNLPLTPYTIMYIVYVYLFAYKLKIYVTVYIKTKQTKHTMIKILKCGIKLKLYKSNYDSFKNAFFFRFAPYIKFRLKKTKQKKDLKIYIYMFLRE